MFTYSFTGGYEQLYPIYRTLRVNPPFWVGLRLPGFVPFIDLPKAAAAITVLLQQEDASPVVLPDTNEAQVRVNNTLKQLEFVSVPAGSELAGWVRPADYWIAKFGGMVPEPSAEPSATDPSCPECPDPSCPECPEPALATLLVGPVFVSFVPEVLLSSSPSYDDPSIA